MPQMPSTVTPAYGRDYKTAKAAKESWLAGKDWAVADIMNRWYGKPISIRDFAPGQSVILRFDGMRKVTRVSKPKTKKNPRRVSTGSRDLWEKALDRAALPMEMEDRPTRALKDAAASVGIPKREIPAFLKWAGTQSNPMERKATRKTMNIPTLKSGINAFYDTMRSGLVPVKVLSVTAPAKSPLFDLRSGLAPVSVKVKAVVTEDAGAYSKGMIIDSDAVHVVPRTAVKHGRYSTTISLYKVEVDAKTNPGCSTKRNPRKPWKRGNYMLYSWRGRTAVFWTGKGWSKDANNAHTFLRKTTVQKAQRLYGGEIIKQEY